MQNDLVLYLSYNTPHKNLFDLRDDCGKLYYIYLSWTCEVVWDRCNQSFLFAAIHERREAPRPAPPDCGCLRCHKVVLIQDPGTVIENGSLILINVGSGS